MLRKGTFYDSDCNGFCPESVRGELTRWFLELKPGVFVGRVNSRIRDLLWKRICETDSAAGAVMVFLPLTSRGLK